MAEAWQQRDFERQVLLENIMGDVYQNLDDRRMLEVATDFLHYIRISVIQGRNLKLHLCKEAMDYMAMIEEFARTPEEKNVMVDRLKDKLEATGTTSLRTALTRQELMEPERIYDLDLLAQED